VLEVYMNRIGCLAEIINKSIKHVKIGIIQKGTKDFHAS
jgi:hypothetical protein